MQLGIVYPQIELGGSPHAVRAIGRGAEEMGYDYLLAYDHVVGEQIAVSYTHLTLPTICIV